MAASKRIAPNSVIGSERREHQALLAAAAGGDTVARAELLAIDLQWLAKRMRDLPDDAPDADRLSLLDRATMIDAIEARTAVDAMWRTWLGVASGDSLYWLTRIDAAASSEHDRLFFGPTERDEARASAANRAIRAWRETRPGARPSGALRGRYVEASAFLKTVGIAATPHDLEKVWEARKKRTRRKS